MRTSTPDSEMVTIASPASVGPSTEGDFHVEAASVEAAVEDARRRTGRDPEVLDVETVTRGGVGGFFARELVRVHLRIAPTGAVANAAVDARPAGGAAPQAAMTRADVRVIDAHPRGVDGVLQALTNVHDERERGFELALRQALLESPRRPPIDREPQEPASTTDVVPRTTTRSSPGGEAPAPSGRRLMSPDVVRRLHTPVRPSAPLQDLPRQADPEARPGVRWSLDSLASLGVPTQVLDRVAPSGDDELAWLRALADAVTPWCRELPEAPSVLAGPRAGPLGEALGLPTCGRSDRVPYGGHVALVATDGRGARAWMNEVRGDRWLHLVVGGSRWEGLLDDEPQAVSVTDLAMMPAVLTLCADRDLALGHQLVSGVAALLAPLDVAMALRTGLPRASER